MVIRLSDDGRGTFMSFKHVCEGHVATRIFDNAGYNGRIRIRKVKSSSRGSFVLVDGKRIYISGIGRLTQ